MLRSLRTDMRRRQDYVPAAVETGSVGSHVASGGLWTGVGLLAVTLIGLVRSMVYARLLPPAAFGVLNLANVFTQFILLFSNFGFTSSIVYWRKLGRLDLATCWWGNLMVDAGAALLCVVFAFTGTRWSDRPETQWIIVLLAMQFLIVSVGSINAALMRRQFLFRPTAMSQIAAAVVTFAAGWILIAVFDAGAYGLVGGVIAGTIAQVLFNFAYMPWLPSFSFSWANLREHADYGRWFLGVNVVTYANQNIDRVLIGTRLSSTQLGYYEYASSLPLQLTVQMGTLLNSVLFPAFASLQDDLVELRRVLLKVMRSSAFILYPFLAGLALTATDVVRVAYGEAWMPIVWPTRAFCLFGMVRVMTNPAYSLCNGVGKPALPFKWSLIALPLNWVVIWLGVWTGDVTTVAVTAIFLPAFMLLTLVAEVSKHIGMPVRQICAAVLPALLCCLIMAAAVLGLKTLPFVDALNPLSRLVAQAIVGGAVYTGSMRLFYGEHFAAMVRLVCRVLPRS